MSTLNIILSKFRKIADSHKQIHSFGIGESWEIGASEASLTPQLWINPIGAFMEKQESTFSTTTYNINMKCFDLVNKGEGNENEVLSDCLQILQDVIAEFNTSVDMQDENIIVDASLNFIPFTERFDQEVSGWETNISIKKPFNSCYSNKPFNR